jgi:hypothetical protein
MKLFGRALLIGWSALALFVSACFTFPKLMSRLFGWFAPFIVLVPVSLFLGTAVFVVLLIFRTGMKRSAE